MRVVFVPEVRQAFEALTDILLADNYYSAKESAVAYVEGLVGDICSALPWKYVRPAPRYFASYGRKLKYAVFRKNRATEWYVFFNIAVEGDELVYTVRHVTNNHTAAKYMSPNNSPKPMKKTVSYDELKNNFDKHFNLAEGEAVYITRAGADTFVLDEEGNEPIDWDACWRNAPVVDKTKVPRKKPDERLRSALSVEEILPAILDVVDRAYTKQFGK